jgi:hypothetical protein
MQQTSSKVMVVKTRLRGKIKLASTLLDFQRRNFEIALLYKHLRELHHAKNK